MQVPPPEPPVEPLVVGRYALYDVIARGGMAAVHFGRLAGAGGFARTVAIKRLHPNLANDPEFVAMLLDEARMVTRIRHPNVVQTLDVVAHSGELLLVMDYIEGESLGRLIRAVVGRGQRVPISIAVNIAIDVLEGLHAAHEAKSDHGEPLGLVHRDVSPQNVLVGIDGVARVIDFGVAKAIGRSKDTEAGRVKGKLSYMSPEQLGGQEVDRRTDVFAASIVLWETLTGKRLFGGTNEGEIVLRLLQQEIPDPSTLVQGVTRELARVVMRGLSRDPALRFPTANEMAHALEAATLSASSREVAAWVKQTAHDALSQRALLVERVERGPVLSPSRTMPASGSAPIFSLGDAAPPSAMPTRLDPSSPGPLEPGTITHASSVSLVSSRTPKSSSRALWVVLGVLAFGATIGAAALVRRAVSQGETAGTDPSGASLVVPASIEPTTPIPVASPPAAPSTAAPPSSVPPPATSAPAARPSTKRPSTQKAPQPASSKPKPSLYSRD